MSGNVLITGASGFVGSHVVAEAFRQGYKVFVTVRSSSNIAHLEPYRVTSLRTDFADVEQLRQLLAENHIEYIAHIAGATRARDLGAFEKANVEVTLNLARAAVASGAQVKKFVFVSSLGAVGPATRYVEEGFTEAEPASPVTFYGQSKLRAEQAIQALPDLPYIILRPTAVYGPREKDLLKVIKGVKSGLETYIGRGKQRLTFVYGPDLARLIVDAFKSPVTREAFNITDGRYYNKYSFAEAIKKTLRNKSVKLHIPLLAVQTVAYGMECLYRWKLTKELPVLTRNRLNELNAGDWGYNIEKAKQLLHFNPSFDLEKGMEETIKWYKENGWI